MNLFLFTNFFPFKKSEPFLVNEFEFAKLNCHSISILSLYGNKKDLGKEILTEVNLCSSVLENSQKRWSLLFRGIFNLASFSHHGLEFFREKLFLQPKKAYWFFVSLLITRAALSSSAYKEMVTTIKKTKKPVLYFYWGDNLTWTIPYLVGHLKGVEYKIVLRLHRTDLYENIKANYAPLRHKIFSLSNLLVTISDNGKDYLAFKYPLITKKLKTSYLGVFDNGINERHATSSFVVVSTSYVISVKRVNLIFDALQKVESKIVWHHFGGGPLFDELRQLVKTRRPDLQIILHGHVTNKELIEFYKTKPVDLFINLSFSEGLPVSIMEALSFGIPVFATKVGGVSELVSNENGRLIERDFDVSELAHMLENFINRPDEEHTGCRKLARKTFEEKVDARINYTTFYKELKALSELSS